MGWYTRSQQEASDSPDKEKVDVSDLASQVENKALSSGYNMKMYHGTWQGGFNTFNEATHFSPEKEYAERYQSPSASSMGTSRRTVTKQQTYEVYMKMERPFDTRVKRCRDLYANEFYGVYGRTPLSESGIPDWTDGVDMYEWISEKHPEFDGLILDEGGEPEGNSVRSRPCSYVPMSPNQVKSANPVTYDDSGKAIPLSSRFDQSNSDIRY